MTNTTLFYTHNGMNLARSVGNPKSRFERVRSYLRKGGPRTKREILRDVFGITDLYPAGQWRSNTYPAGAKTISYASFVFTLGIKYGYFILVRKNGTMYWTLGPE